MVFYCPYCGNEVEKEGMICERCERKANDEVSAEQIGKILESTGVAQQLELEPVTLNSSEPSLSDLDSNREVTPYKPGKVGSELPMEKMFDEIFYLRNYRRNNLNIIGGTFLFITGFLIWMMWSVFQLWNVYFGYYDPFWFIIAGLGLECILGVVWLIRGRDLKRGIPYSLRPRKKKYSIFRKHLYSRLGLVPKAYYASDIDPEDKERELLLWASNKRLGIGFKILQYMICAILGLVAIILVNQYAAFFGMTLVPINIAIFMLLIGILSIVPNSIRKYHCLSPIYFTSWILHKWMAREQLEPYGLYFKSLYINLLLIAKNYQKLEIKEINQIVANIFSYFIIRTKKGLEVSAEIDRKLNECLSDIDQFIEKFAIDHKQYLNKSKEDRSIFNNNLDKGIEQFFFKFLLVTDDIQRYNETQIGKVSIKFKIDWKQRLWENFSKLLFSAGAASVVAIITGLVSTL